MSESCQTLTRGIGRKRPFGNGNVEGANDLHRPVNVVLRCNAVPPQAILTGLALGITTATSTNTYQLRHVEVLVEAAQFA